MKKGEIDKSPMGATHSAQKYPGRNKGARDGERTRRNLLKAAYWEFSRAGYHGASIARICKRAGVSKQILSHHFGSKEKAYLAVLEAAYVDFRSYDPKLDVNADPVSTLRDFVLFTFDHVMEHKNFVSLLSGENVNKGRVIRKSAKLKHIYDPLVQRLTNLLAAGEAKGLFRSGLDARQLYVSITALCFFTFSNGYTLSAVLGTDITTDAALIERRKHVLDLTMAAVSVRSQDQSEQAGTLAKSEAS